MVVFRFFKSKKLIVSIFIILVVLIIFYLMYLNNDNSVTAIDEVEEIIHEDVVNEEIKKIKVDIKGMVNNPGVYEIDDGSRVIDQTTPNMIQRISGIFERNALISKEI